MSKNDDTPPTFFVTRRGRQVGVHQVDLSDMDIESGESAQAPEHSPKVANVSKQKPRLVTATKQPFRWSRKKVIVLVVLFVIVTLPLVALEVVAAQYREGSASAKRDLDSLIEKTVLPAQKKTTVDSKTIRGIASDVNDIVARMCRGGLLDNAAGLYPRAATALADCKADQARYAALTSELYSLEKVARYLEDMDRVMKPVASPITDEYAVIGAQQSQWLAASDALKELSVPDEMRAAHASLASHVAAVSGAWSALNTANNEQDAAGFTDAEKKLASEYEAIRAASGEFTEVLAKNQAELLASYNALK